MIAKSPQNSFAFLLRGKALLTQGELDRAMADFNEALTIKPKYSEALAARGMVWSKKRDFGNALADLDQSIAQEERVESYYMRAQIYEAQGNSERAVADFHKATELPPKGLFDAIAQANAKKQIEQARQAYSVRQFRARRRRRRLPIGMQPKLSPARSESD